MHRLEQIWRRIASSQRTAGYHSTVAPRDASTAKISEPIEPWRFRGDHRQAPTSNHGDPTCVQIADDRGDGVARPAECEPVCQVMSDLHLEWRGYEQFEITRKAPNLLLVGDIGRFCDYDRLFNFLRRQCKLFDHVLLVPGNHEFYGSSRQEGLDLAARLELELQLELGEKFTFMHRRKVVLIEGDVVVLGCTLHSLIPNGWTALTNDFARIRDWRIKGHNQEHAVDLEWLQKSLREVKELSPKSRVIIATHYAPSFEKTVHPKHTNNGLSNCFCSDALGKLRSCSGMDQVSHWVFGHTHYNTCFQYDDITVLSNQPSGPTSNECSGRQFNPNLII